MTFQRIDAGARVLSDFEKREIEDVLDAAVEWEAGRLPFDEAIRIGTVPNARGNPSPEWTRALAFRNVPKSDPRKESLYRLSENGSRMQGKIQTAQGWFTRQEVHDNELTIRRMIRERTA